MHSTVTGAGLLAVGSVVSSTVMVWVTVDRVTAGIRYRVGPGDDFRTAVTVRYIRYKRYYRSDRAVVCFICYYRDIWQQVHRLCTVR